MTRVLGTPRGALRFLLIGGLDPSGAAGVMADLRALEGLPIWPEVVVSALTEQSGSPLILGTDLHCFTTSLERALKRRPHAIKVGMLAAASQAKVVAKLRKRWAEDTPLVVDPVLQSSGSVRLYAGHPSSLWPLLGAATLITPNLPEAQTLCSRTDSDPLSLWQEMRAHGAGAVLLKGGHATGTRVLDHFFSGRSHRVFSSLRQSFEVRGTGCALATRIAANLALGIALEPAVAKAERWLAARYLSAREIR